MENVRDERGGRFRLTVYSNRFEVGSWAPKESA